jgi:serine/threonine protein kinase
MRYIWRFLLGLREKLVKRKPFQSRINKVSLTPSNTVVKKAGRVFRRHFIRYDPIILLRREAMFLEKLEGHHAPRLISIGQDWIEMSYCGMELTSTNLPSDWRSQIKRIVAVLSEKKIIHRDIKPGNILVNEGKIYLIDFGWAIYENEIPYTMPREKIKSVSREKIYDNKAALIWACSLYENKINEIRN